MSAIGIIAIATGLFFAWVDMAGNGAQDAEWAGLLLTVATLGAVLVGAEHYGVVR